MKKLLTAFFKALSRNISLGIILVGSGTVSGFLNWLFFSGIGASIGFSKQVLGLEVTSVDVYSALGIVFDVAKLFAPFFIAYFFFNKNTLAWCLWLAVFLAGVGASLVSTKSTVDNGSNAVKSSIVSHERKLALANDEVNRITQELANAQKEIDSTNASIASTDAQKAKANRTYQVNQLNAAIADMRAYNATQSAIKQGLSDELKAAKAELKALSNIEPPKQNEFTKNSEVYGWLFSLFLELINFTASFSLGVRNQRTETAQQEKTIQIDTQTAQKEYEAVQSGAQEPSDSATVPPIFDAQAVQIEAVPQSAPKQIDTRLAISKQELMVLLDKGIVPQSARTIAEKYQFSVSAAQRIIAKVRKAQAQEQGQAKDVQTASMLKNDVPPSSNIILLPNYK